MINLNLIKKVKNLSKDKLDSDNKAVLLTPYSCESGNPDSHKKRNQNGNDKIVNLPARLFFYQALKSQNGIAYVEMLPLLVLFVLLFGLSFGLWASIHRATLKSIAARHYSFEVLNNRTHYIYHRDTESANDYKAYYGENGLRFFANVYKQSGRTPALKKETARLSLFDEGVTKINPPSSKNSTRIPVGEQKNPIEIKTGYGICIDTPDCNIKLR